MCRRRGGGEAGLECAAFAQTKRVRTRVRGRCATDCVGEGEEPVALADGRRGDGCGRALTPAWADAFGRAEARRGLCRGLDGPHSASPPRHRVIP